MAKSHASLSQLSVLCRGLSTTLLAGVHVVKAFQLGSKKVSDSRLRLALENVVVEIKGGSDIASALKAQVGVFPDLMLGMVSVAERTGSLPEVLKALAEHYENNIRLKRDFISQITLPVLQMIAAIGVIGLLIFIMGMLPSAGGKPFDPLGWGLVGGEGALIWMGGWLMLLATLFTVWKIGGASLPGLAIMQQTLMNVPVVGTCLRSFAIARFSWAYHLTQNAGLPVDESLDASLQATANGVFMRAAPHIISDINNGDPLAEALDKSKLFGEEFIHIVDVGEQTGTVPEALDRLSPQFEEQARRSLRALTMALGWVIWLIVAIFIVFIIFTIFKRVWLDPINEVLRDV